MTSQIRLFCRGIGTLMFATISSLCMICCFSCETNDAPAAADDDSADDDDNTDADADDDDQDDDSGFDDDDDNDDNDDNNDEADTDSNTGDICDEWAIEISVVPTRLMILEDVSRSMADGTPPKWDQARDAMKSMLEQFASSIEFGLDTFSDLGSSQTQCVVSAPVVSDTKPDNGQPLIDVLDSVQIGDLGGSTPLYLGMQNFADPSYAPQFLSQEFTSYLVVVSDGEDRCGTDGQTPATPQELAEITSRLLNERKVMTFAIGFGADVSADQLNAIAQNGGSPYTTYLDAQDQAQLEQVFDDIGAIAVSCVYEIGDIDSSVNMDEVNFYFDGVVVGYDEDCKLGKGWTWENADKTKVLFCKEACDKLKSGAVVEISATFGCDTVIIQ